MPKTFEEDPLETLAGPDFFGVPVTVPAIDIPGDPNRWTRPLSKFYKTILAHIVDARITEDRAPKVSRFAYEDDIRYPWWGRGETGYVRLLLAARAKFEGGKSARNRFRDRRLPLDKAGFSATMAELLEDPNSTGTYWTVVRETHSDLDMVSCQVAYARAFDSNPHKGIAFDAEQLNTLRSGQLMPPIAKVYSRLGEVRMGELNPGRLAIRHAIVMAEHVEPGTTA